MDIPKDLEVAQDGGINWCWFQVRHGNLVAEFRLHHGEEPLASFEKLMKHMKEVDDFFPVSWRDKKATIANHWSHTKGYRLPEVLEAFRWLGDLFRAHADSLERESCGDDPGRYLEYHGVAVLRLLSL